MERPVRLLGHPVHPMLVVLPSGLLSMAVLFDGLYLLGGGFLFAEVAFWNLGVGIAGGLVASVIGFIDWLAIPAGTRARAVGVWHGAGNVVILALFGSSLWLRLADHAYAPALAPFVLAALAATLALGTAWLGGELVYRHAVGVDAWASLDATASFDDEASWRIPRPG